MIKIIQIIFLIILILRTGTAEISESTDPPIPDSDRNGTAAWPVPLPSRFHFYDLDGDGALTLKELAKVTGTSRNDARAPFEAADENGDNRITEKEFDNAPWLFGDLPPHLINQTMPAQPRRRAGRRRRPSKKKSRRQNQKRLKKKFASGSKVKKSKSD